MQKIVNILCLLPFLFVGKYWRNAHNRRKFFIEFASQKGFDPLVAINWQNVQYKEIKQVKRKRIQKRERREIEI